MAVSLNEDVLAHLLGLLYHDEENGRPDQHTLAALCLVNHTIHHIAHKLLYMWICLPTNRAAQAFLASCRRRPALGRATHIFQLDLKGRMSRQGRAGLLEGVMPKLFPLLLSCCPNARMLIITALEELPAAVLTELSATQAARGLRVLHLTSYKNNVVHQLIPALPAVDRLQLDVEYIDTAYPTLFAGRAFREVCVSIETGTPPYVCAAFMLPVWEPPAQPEVFSLRFGCEFFVLSGFPGPFTSLRSLGLDAWTDKLATFVSSCPNLVELKLWHPLGVSSEATQRFLFSLPDTLEHLVYPSQGETWPSHVQREPYDARELADFASRMRRLTVISTYDVPETDGMEYLAQYSSQSAWAAALPRYAEGAGIRFRRFSTVERLINAGITLQPDVFPPPPIRTQLAALPIPPILDDAESIPRPSGSRLRSLRRFLRLLWPAW